MNERDILRHKLCSDKSQKDYDRRGLESQLDHETKMAREKLNRLEEVNTV